MKRLPVIAMTLTLTMILAGCSTTTGTANEPVSVVPDSKEEVSLSSEENMPETLDSYEDVDVTGTLDEEETIQPEDGNADEEATLQPEDGSSDTNEATDSDDATDTDDVAETASEDGDEAADTPPDENAPVKGQPIVWLGDSLTQGSLGDNNDNLPGAPYEKLKTLVNVPVEGYGYYGLTTHDVLWLYTAKDQLGQTADPHKTYIFWLGSNDWVKEEGPNSDTEPVINEIDRFLHLEGNIPNYIVIGTTTRHRLGDLYIPINHDLEEHYGDHYMDVVDIINKYGYSPDKTHLSQESYDAIAVAVSEKLKALGYI